MNARSAQQVYDFFHTEGGKGEGTGGDGGTVMEKARKKVSTYISGYDASIRKKIFFGYLAIIGIVLLCVIALFAVLWEKLNKDSISKSIYSSNYQIVKSICITILTAL